MLSFHLQVHGKPPFFQSMHWEHEPSQTKNPRVHQPEKNHSKVLSKQRREDRIYTNLSRMKSTATRLRNEAQGCDAESNPGKQVWKMGTAPNRGCGTFSWRLTSFWGILVNSLSTAIFSPYGTEH